MDKLLSIRNKPISDAKVSLAISSAPQSSYENVSYCDIAEDLRGWLTDDIPGVCFVSGAVGSGISSLLQCIMNEINIEPHYIDHSSKNFNELLEDSSHISKSISGRKIAIVVDGIDSSSGKRITGILTDHVKTRGKHKLIVVGHREKKVSSNEFAKKWKQFEFPTPSNETVFQKLQLINKERISESVVATIVRSNSPGDFRSCINSLEMQLVKTTNTVNAGDSFIDGIDAIKYVLKNDSHPCLVELFKIYEKEPSMIKNGVFENYLKCFTSIDVVSKISDSLSVGDTIGFGDNTVVECAFFAGDAKLATKTKKPAIEKYGTARSKDNNQKMNAKKLKVVSEKMVEHGSLRIPYEELHLLRDILKNDFSGTILQESEYLLLFRTGLEKYTHDKRLFKKT